MQPSEWQSCSGPPLSPISHRSPVLGLGFRDDLGFRVSREYGNRISVKSLYDIFPPSLPSTLVRALGLRV